MSEIEPVKGGASWNVDTLKKHVDALLILRDTARASEIDALTKLIHAALSAAKEAVVKAEVASDKRFESVNEFRSQLSDQQKTFVTRNELDNLKEQVARLEKLSAQDEGKSMGVGMVAALIVGAMTVIGVIINVVLNWLAVR